MKAPLMKFIERNNKTYEVRNHEYVFVGDIEKLHVGRFFHWCLSPQPDTFFTNGCLKEITQFITSLYALDKKPTKRYQMDKESQQVFESYEKLGLHEGNIEVDRFYKVASDLGLSKNIGYFAWLMNEGTGKGADLFIEVLREKNDALDKQKGTSGGNNEV